MERRVIFDFVNVLKGEASLKQAVIPDRRCSNLLLLAASQTKDKSALELSAVGKLLASLKEADEVDVIIADSPAGIESGAHHAMYFADEAVICTNPELSSLRDADKMVGLLLSKSAGAEAGIPPSISLLVTRYNADRAQDGDALSVNDITEMLGLPLLGVIPDNPKAVLRSTNMGNPAIMAENEAVSGSYNDVCERLLGNDKPLRFTEPVPKSFLSRLFGSRED
jgi:septum site-determining protein MinD